MSNLSIRFYRSYTRDCFKFIVLDKGEPTSRKWSYATDMVMKTFEEREQLPESCIFRMKKDECQQIMDSLWQLGLRPSGEGSEGQLKALESHLKDMRDIAFKYINKEIKDANV